MLMKQKRDDIMIVSKAELLFGGLTRKLNPSYKKYTDGYFCCFFIKYRRGYIKIKRQHGKTYTGYNIKHCL